jgi:menaquinone-dependent protoporphyrinogen oxidase
MAGTAEQTTDVGDPSATDGDGRHVLVAYATRFGSTRGVAERIAARLTERGLEVRLAPVAEVDGVGEFDAVVFGSPVFDQRWMPEAEGFALRNRTALAQRPVWLFSVGTFGDSKRLIGPLMRREPRDIGELQQAVAPRGYRVFAGVIDRRQWPLGSRLFFHAFGGRLGDNRDWPQIDAWAEQIAGALPRAPERG